MYIYITYIYIYIYGYTHIYVHMFNIIYGDVQIYIYEKMDHSVFTCVCVCVYTSIHTYRYMQRYIYTYVCKMKHSVLVFKILASSSSNVCLRVCATVQVYRETAHRERFHFQVY